LGALGRGLPIVGEQLGERFGQLRSLDAAVLVNEQRCEEALVDLSPQVGWWE